MFRHANERLAQGVAAAVGIDHRHIAFFCECADDDCVGRLNATLGEFGEAHLTSQHYFILPRHPTVDAEEAIEQNGRYEVVVKETAY